MRNGKEVGIEKTKKGWFNGEVDLKAEDRQVVVWTRLHNRQTELQRMMTEVVKNYSHQGIATHRRIPLSAVEEGRWIEGRHQVNEDL